MNQHNIVKTGCSNCSDKADILGCLCKTELDQIDSKRIEVHFKAGELIFKQGTPNLHFLCLTKGKVKMYIEGFNKKNLILGIVKPIQYILGPGVYSDHMHHFSALAIEDSVACLVDVDTFKSLVRNNPAFADDFMKKMNLQSIDTYELIISLTQKQMPGRIADVLINLSEKVYEANPFQTTLSRQDLADMSGMSKESAIRILKEFRDMDIITVEGNDIHILNSEHLHHISQTG